MVDDSDKERLLYVARVLQGIRVNKYAGHADHVPMAQQDWQEVVMSMAAIRRVLDMGEEEFYALVREPNNENANTRPGESTGDSNS